MKLSDPIGKIGRLNTNQAKALKRLRIETVGDLVHHFPTRYSDISQLTPIDLLEPGQLATVYGKLLNPKIKKSFRTRIPMAEAQVEDIKGNKIKVVWFNQAFLAKTLQNGELVKLTGKVSEGKYGLSLANPEVERIPELPIDSHDSLFGTEKHQEFFGFPVYRLTRGITSRWFYHAIQKALGSDLLETLADPIPEDLRNKYNLPSLRTALVWIHRPQKASDAEAAKKRFAFQEVFFIQLQKQLERKEYEKHHSFKLNIDKDKMKDFVGRFPFTPTNSQSKAIDAITADMSGDRPMSRLLEGDVGSGKTFVAAVTSHAVITNRPNDQDFGNLQVAYMAPTEVLATQLFENFVQYFAHTGIQIGLITGSGCKKFPSKVDPSGWTNISKNQLLKWVKNGEVPIVVGTHALISKKVEFKDLALVIVDEQHRFGTNQRMKLARTKDDRIPHYLSMSATPIPRTLALTIYGNLDLTIIDQMPKGRKPVETTIVRPDKRDKVYESIQKELDDGRQAYVICPRIDEPDPDKERTLQLKSVKAEAKRLKTNVFPKAEVDIMHSKMTKPKKAESMDRFYQHETDILVSTSVVEVGVNVPNANVIVIEGAERFGLAQLHQLRGRVIRGTHQPYCYLFTDSTNAKTAERLQALANANNGFELAELDLMMRGAGDIAGQKQWGMSDLAMEALKNVKMVEAARTEATNLVENKTKLAEQLVVHQKDLHLE